MRSGDKALALASAEWDGSLAAWGQQQVQSTNNRLRETRCEAKGERPPEFGQHQWEMLMLYYIIEINFNSYQSTQYVEMEKLVTFQLSKCLK